MVTHVCLLKFQIWGKIKSKMRTEGARAVHKNVMKHRDFLTTPSTFSKEFAKKPQGPLSLEFQQLRTYV
jgi:hypothetical protein